MLIANKNVLVDRRSRIWGKKGKLLEEQQFCVSERITRLHGGYGLRSNQKLFNLCNKREGDYMGIDEGNA